MGSGKKNGDISFHLSFAQKTIIHRTLDPWDFAHRRTNQRPTDRQADSNIPPSNFVCRGYNYVNHVSLTTVQGYCPHPDVVVICKVCCKFVKNNSDKFDDCIFNIGSN